MAEPYLIQVRFLISPRQRGREKRRNKVTKPLKCREHNGIFRIEVRRGRPPVKCSPENPCDNARPKRNRVVTKENTATAAQKLAALTGLREEQIVIGKPSRVERAASAIKNRRTAVVEKVGPPKVAKQKRAGTHNSPGAVPARLSASDRPAQTSAEKVAAVRTDNPSVQVAQAARSELEAVGWVAKGRGWSDGADMYAELTASRGSETIVLTWCNGNLTGQDYSIWHSKPSKNAMPKRRLKFNPDEMTDGELIRAISGMKVTWWNSLAKSEESFTVGAKTLSIEHTFAANGDEDSSRRVVKFVDLNGGGFRHFHVDALLKVG